MVLEHMEHAVPVTTAKMKSVNSKIPHRVVVADSPPAIFSKPILGSTKKGYIID